MTDVAASNNRILGVLRALDGKGSAQLQEHFDTDVDDLWSALTEPDRLSRWLGEFTGELRPGGEFRATFWATGWDGTGRIEVCEPPRRVRLVTTGTDEPDDHVIEATLRPDGDRTVLTVEERGMPLDHLPGYGAGLQVHLEDLASHVAGGGRCDATARWNELVAVYRERNVETS